MLESRAMSSDRPPSRKQRQPKLLDATALWSYSLKILGMRALSTGEVRDKLRRKAENPDDIDGIISRLRDYGYLNDARFADSYARARRDGEGFGKMRVIRDLRQRRVAPTVAEQAVQGAFAETDETEMIEAYLARKYRGKNLPEFLREAKNLKSAYSRLRYAGFGVGPSIRVLKRYAAQAEELEADDDSSFTAE
jgi:regulatory protein